MLSPFPVFLAFLLALNAAALAVGQLLFKATASHLRELPFAEFFWKLASLPAFYAACFIYATATFLWIFILTKIPLSTAYPFVGLSFVFVALAGYVFLGESPSVGTWVGIVMVGAGVAIIAASSSVPIKAS